MNNPPDDKIGPEPDGYLNWANLAACQRDHQIAYVWPNDGGKPQAYEPITILEHSTYLEVVAELRHAQDIYVHDFNDAAVGRIESLLSKLSERK